MIRHTTTSFFVGQSYGFDANALSFIQSYFSNRYQKIKVGDKFSKWQKISAVLPQGSILTLFFSTFLLMISWLINETTTLCNYSDGNITSSSNKNTKIIISRLRNDFAIISEQFYENYVVLNTNKFHFPTACFNEPFQIFLSTILQLRMLPRKRFSG